MFLSSHQYFILFLFPAQFSLNCEHSKQGKLARGFLPSAFSRGTQDAKYESDLASFLKLLQTVELGTEAGLSP